MPCAHRLGRGSALLDNGKSRRVGARLVSGAGLRRCLSSTLYKQRLKGEVMPPNLVRLHYNVSVRRLLGKQVCGIACPGLGLPYLPSVTVAGPEESSASWGREGAEGGWEGGRLTDEAVCILVPVVPVAPTQPRQGECGSSDEGPHRYCQVTDATRAQNAASAPPSRQLSRRPNRAPTFPCHHPPVSELLAAVGFQRCPSAAVSARKLA